LIWQILQGTYFGSEKGMSLLVNSYVWKDQASVLSTTSAKTTSLSAPTFSSQPCITTLTDAAQTELSSLRPGEIIIKQFETEYHPIKKVQMHTDNGDNFSPHSTPDTHTVICERVRFSSNGITFYYKLLFARDYSEIETGKTYVIPSA
jgi:hypothetical protein